MKMLYIFFKKFFFVFSIIFCINTSIANAFSTSTPLVNTPYLDAGCPANAVSNYNQASSTNGVLIANALMNMIPDASDNNRSFTDFNGIGDSSIVLPTNVSLNGINNSSSTVNWGTSDNRVLFLGAYTPRNVGYVAFYPTERIIKLCLSVQYQGEDSVFVAKDIRIPRAEIRSFVEDPDNPSKTRQYYRILNDTFSNTQLNNTLYTTSLNSGGVGYNMSPRWTDQIFKLNGSALHFSFNVLNTGVLWNGTTTRCASSISCTPTEIFRDLKNITSANNTSCVDVRTGIALAYTSATTSQIYGCNKWPSGFASGILLAPGFANARYITDYVIAQAPTFNPNNRTGPKFPAPLSINGGYNRYGILAGPYIYLRGYLNPENRAGETAGTFKAGDPLSSFLPLSITAEIHGGQYEPRFYNCNINDTILFDAGIGPTLGGSYTGRYNGDNHKFVSNSTTDPRCSGYIQSNLLVNQKIIYSTLNYKNNNIWGTPSLLSLFKKGIPACRSKTGSTFSYLEVNFNTSIFNKGCDTASYIPDRIGKLPASWNQFYLHYNLSSAHGFRSDFDLTDDELRQLFEYDGVKYDNLSVWLPVDSKNNIEEKNYYPAFRLQTGDPTPTASFPNGQPYISGAKVNSLLNEYDKNRKRELESSGSWRR